MNIGNYIRDNYGLCVAEPCACRRTAWIGTACPNFRTFDAKTWDELRVAQQELRQWVCRSRNPVSLTTKQFEVNG